MKLLLILLFSGLISPAKALAAACCGGGSSSASLITSDDLAQFSTSYSTVEVVIDNVDSQGIWRKSSNHQVVSTLKLDASRVIFDRWQVGGSVPVIQRRKDGQEYSGLGDVALTAGYEYLPDWNYNPIRPKGVGFLQLTLPTGKSRADSEVGGLDSRGNGFWAIGLGTVLTKSWLRWDASAQAEVHHSFERDLTTSSIQGRQKPGNGGSFGSGVGYNINDYRIGTQLSWNYEDPIEIESVSTPSKGSVERYATFSLIGSYTGNEEWSGSVAYLDQTLIGSPVNTSLGRGVSISLVRRWGR